MRKTVAHRLLASPDRPTSGEEPPPGCGNRLSADTLTSLLGSYIANTGGLVSAFLFERMSLIDYNFSSQLRNGLHQLVNHAEKTSQLAHIGWLTHLLYILWVRANANAGYDVAQKGPLLL